ncbi:MAG TPA: hypothetical protein PLC99_14285 [Verrucomicrobiota bacterium]|nr:hypothetical protein [Verrucomicrobiota bacterium]
MREEADRYVSSFLEGGKQTDEGAQGPVAHDDESQPNGAGAPSTTNCHADPTPGETTEGGSDPEVYEVQSEDLEEVDSSLGEFAIPAAAGPACPDEKPEGPVEDAREVPPERLRDRVRGRPELLVPVGGVLLAAVMIGSAMCGSSRTNEAKDASAARAEFPQLETPEVRDKPFEKEEVERLLLDADRKEAARKRNANAIAASLAVIAKAEKLEPSKPVPAAVQNAPLVVRHLQPYKKRPAPPAPPPVEVPPATAAKVEKERVILAGYLQPGVIKLEGGAEVGQESVPAGASFKVKLQVGVSTAFSGTAVLAKLVEPIRGSDGRTILPAGATLQGDFRGSDERVLLNFHTVVVGGKKLPLKAYAVQNGLPGLRAKVVRRRREDPSQGTRAVAGGGVGLLRAATTVVGGLTSPVGAQLVDEMTSDGLNDLDREANERGAGFGLQNKVLELPAGLIFDVVTAG